MKIRLFFKLFLFILLFYPFFLNAAESPSSASNNQTASKTETADTKNAKTEIQNKGEEQEAKQSFPITSEKVFTENGTLNHPFFDLQVSTENINNKYTAIKSGEYLEYDIYLGVTRVGVAWIFCDGIVNIGTHTAYHLISGVRSASFVEKLYKVKDRNDSWFDTETLYSYGYYKELNEGHYFFNEWTIFDSENKKYFGKKLNRKKELSSFDGDLEMPVSDILSSMYMVRAMRMKKGEKILIDVNTKKNWQMEANVLRTEKIATIFGKKKCIVGEPKVGSEGIFVSKAGKRLFVWLTDDEEQIPVLMKAETFFGSISAKLTKREMRYDNKKE